MAYADQSMSGNKITALIIVALIHIFVGYALVTGLAYEAAKKVMQKVTTVDIKEEVKKEEPPPPPPKQEQAPPPPIAPPVKINVATTPPPITTVTTAPPPPPTIILAPPAPVPAPPPPPPKGPSAAAQPRGNPASWATANDYPARALREERTGTTGFRVTVGTDGRVIDCQITSSSGHADLDQATCDNVRRRARFKPAMENGEPVQGSYSNRIRWVIPE
ncbi:energy transducer TonB [Novosphingobium album (ex Liu et al. 2023)]|uniref:Energy transducer TonB n=1 Tax=Novosphingobium album (ex Liu et al. 2023) TaxID=3031130 RepID=A0ABT5WLC7_9SPHN|nr:energy transducer TonB [Novosphingobium album (ex Liu et al. 2023)]MDE8650845.1 energy transducer TonB [Novosphingobium album (ex Liu et al. 2023)]